jgi:hypothetical protein
MQVSKDIFRGDSNVNAKVTDANDTEPEEVPETVCTERSEVPETQLQAVRYHGTTKTQDTKTGIQRK